MPQYIINEDGSRTIKSRYARKGVLTLCEIFPDEVSNKMIRKRKGYKGSLQKKYKIHDNAVLVRKIFAHFIVKVLKKVLDGDIFIMSSRTRTNITIKSLPDADIKRLRQGGFYADYDIVKANFKIPTFVYDFGPYSTRKDMEIYLPKEMREELLKRAENRQIPWLFIPKTLDRC